MIRLCPFRHVVDLFVRVRTDLEKSWKMTFAWKNHGILIFQLLSWKNHGIFKKSIKFLNTIMEI